MALINFQLQNSDTTMKNFNLGRLLAIMLCMMMVITLASCGPKIKKAYVNSPAEDPSIEKYYLRLEGIDGNAKSDGYEDYIEISSLSISSGERDNNGKKEICNIYKFSCPLDNSSLSIMFARAKGTVIPSGEICIRADESDDIKIIKLDNITVEKADSKADKGSGTTMVHVELCSDT